MVYRRRDEGFHREAYLGLEAVILLPEIEGNLALAEVYAKVKFEPIVEEDIDQ